MWVWPSTLPRVPLVGEGNNSWQTLQPWLMDPRLLTHLATHQPDCQTQTHHHLVRNPQPCGWWSLCLGSFLTLVTNPLWSMPPNG